MTSRPGFKRSPSLCDSPRAIRLSQDTAYFRNRVSPKFWHLMRHYVVQFNDYACSVAAVSMVLNAALASSSSPGEATVITQTEILERVHAVDWKARVSREGYRGSHGLPITELGEAITASLTAFNIPFDHVETQPLSRSTPNLSAQKHRLHQTLASVESSTRDFLLAHFTQGEFIGTWYGGHISPVGAFDGTRSRVLILDVDRECHEPYWVPFDRFFTGLTGENKRHGSVGGGYVTIRMEG